MSLPAGTKLQKTSNLFVVYFQRKDNSRDSCGYAHRNKTAVKRIKLTDLDKFKKKPKHWSEIEQLLLTGAELDD